jgi:hypothetical protein
LAGRVVLVQTWSDSSEYCRQVMPGLASYEKNMRGSGLVVLGVARQSTREAALEVARQSGVDFPIIDGATLPEVQEKIPQYIVYDHTGEIVHRQTESTGEQGGLAPRTLSAIDKALTRSGPVLDVIPEEFQEKEINKLARRASKGSGLGKLLSDLDVRITQGSEAERIEGERLRDQIVAYGERVLADAEAVRAERPHRHFDMMKDLAKEFKGHDLGDKAESVLTSIKQDKAAMREVEASRLYEKMQFATERERQDIYKTLKKKYAETRYAQLAADEMGEQPAPLPPSGPLDKGGDDDDEEEDD